MTTKRSKTQVEPCFLWKWAGSLKTSQVFQSAVANTGGGGVSMEFPSIADVDFYCVHSWTSAAHVPKFLFPKFLSSYLLFLLCFVFWKEIQHYRKASELFFTFFTFLCVLEFTFYNAISYSEHCLRLSWILAGGKTEAQRREISTQSTQTLDFLHLGNFGCR